MSEKLGDLVEGALETDGVLPAVAVADAVALGAARGRASISVAREATDVAAARLFKVAVTGLDNLGAVRFCHGERSVGIVVVVTIAGTRGHSGAVSVAVELAVAAGAVDDTTAEVVLLDGRLRDGEGEGVGAGRTVAVAVAVADASVLLVEDRLGVPSGGLVPALDGDTAGHGPAAGVDRLVANSGRDGGVGGGVKGDVFNLIRPAVVFSAAVLNEDLGVLGTGFDGGTTLFKFVKDALGVSAELVSLRILEEVVFGRADPLGALETV